MAVEQDRAGAADRTGRRPLRNPRGDYYNPDVVVALKHLDLVGQELRGLLGEGAHEVVETSEDLGLALLRLTTDTRTAADTVIGRLSDDRDRAEAQLGRTHLDRLLRALRCHFRRHYAGWTPTFGKNRLVGNVEGGGRISHGDSGPPVRAASGFEPPPRRGTRGDRVRVGVLDTSVTDHDWLLGGWTASADGVLPAGAPHAAVAGHATFITGLVLHQAPGCQVLVQRVLSDEDGEAEVWEVAKAIARIGRAGVDVLNLSLVCFTEDGEAPLVLTTAIDRLPPETVVVAAAGNHGQWQRRPAGTDDAEPDDAGDPPPDDGSGYGYDDGDRQQRDPAYPAALDRVLAVGAVDTDGVRPPFTPRRAPWIDVHAPGAPVVSTYLSGEVRLGDGDATTEFGGYAGWSGSSFSAALVSGAIAARTVPGRVPARQAWEELAAELQDVADGDAAARQVAAAGPAAAPRPTWLRLADLTAPSEERPLTGTA